LHLYSAYISGTLEVRVVVLFHIRMPEVQIWIHKLVVLTEDFHGFRIFPQAYCRIVPHIRQRLLHSTTLLSINHNSDQLTAAGYP